MIYQRATGPATGKCMPGAVNLMQTILFFDGKVLAFNGCYANRDVRGGSTLSCHAEGRAIDFNAKMPNGLADPRPIPPDSPADIAIHKWMWVFVATSDQINNFGVQRFIYKRTMWTVGRGTETLGRYSALAREHQQHIHIEMTKHAAATLSGQQIHDALFRR